MRVHRARWILPISRPVLEDAWVATDAGQVVAVGTGVAPSPGRPASPIDAVPDVVTDPWEGESCAILPGLVNAHTHLELSWMRGRIGPDSSMPAWAGRLVALRMGASPDEAERRAACARAIDEARATGTALVGDIGNGGDAIAPLAGSALFARVFRELIGFRVTDPSTIVAQAQAAIDAVSSDRLKAALAPHAPYSVSPALLRALEAQAPDVPLSIHLGESPEEVRFLRDGTGAWRELLERVGAWTPDWRAPEASPVDYLRALGLVSRRLLAVHGTQLNDTDLTTLAAAGATLVTCPRSNRWTGAGDPPIDRFYASGVRVAIGTDSLASVESLSVFDELAAVRRLSAGVPARTLLRSATAIGAEALGFGSLLGTIAPGSHAALLAVRVPPGVHDVEEYLVTGVAPSDIRWIQAD